MEQYSREILSLYLWDVCRVENLCKKLQREQASCQGKIDLCTEKLKRRRRPAAKDRPGPGSILQRMDDPGGLLVCGAFGLFPAWLAARMDSPPIACLLGAAGIFLMSLVVFALMSDLMNAVRSRENARQEALRYNSALDRENPWYEQQLERNREELEQLRQKLAEAHKLRQQLYDIGFPPELCRSAQGAVQSSCGRPDREQAERIAESEQDREKQALYRTVMALDQRVSQLFQADTNCQ